MKKNTLVYSIILLIISLSIRLFHIINYAEFLGDQGRDALSIISFWQNKTFPIHGPPNSLGQYQGPLYYYMIGIPLIIAQFNPIAPTIVITIIEGLTAVLLFILGKKLFGTWIGFTISFLYAINPYIILSSRLFWNPTTIPFFATIILLSIYHVYKKQLKWIVAYFIATGCIIQLHYSGFFYLPLILLFTVYLFFTKTYQDKKKLLFKWILYGAFSFFIIVLPFILFEYKRGFSDIISALTSTPTVFERNKPFHYYLFLLPLLFLFLGVILYLSSKKNHLLSILIALLLSIYTIVKIPLIWQNPKMDIPRTSYFAKMMIKIAHNTPFSFAVFSSRSFSDLHYRYYLKIYNAYPKRYTNTNYKKLFLICESGSCPEGEKILTTDLLQTICFEPICNKEYPRIRLNNWLFEKEIRYQNAVMYVLNRK